MGKSSLLAHLPNLLPDNYIPVYFDAQGASQNEWSFFSGLAQNIQGAVQQFSPGPIPIPGVSTFRDLPFAVFTQWFSTSVGPLIGERKLLITIDEFEKIGDAIRKADAVRRKVEANLLPPSALPAKPMTSEILDHFRSLIQTNPSVLLLFSGAQTLEALAPNIANYFISVESIQLGYLDEKSARELIVAPVPASVGTLPTYESAAVEQILNLTHCQPFLIQATCSQIIDLANKRPDEITTITLDIVEEARETVFDAYPFFFTEIWQMGELFEMDDETTLEADVQRILLAVVRGESIDAASDDQHHAQALKLLIQRRILRPTDAGYTIEIPYVDYWLRSGRYHQA